MSTTPRERSLSRRLSQFFSPSSSGALPSSPAPAWKSSQDLTQFESRGRAPTKKLSKDSGRSNSASLLRPPSSYRTPQDRTTPQSPSTIRPVTSDGPLSLPPPISTDGPMSRPSSRPTSRTPSPHVRSHLTYPPPHEPSPPQRGVAKTRTFSVENDRKLKRRSWLPGNRSQSRSNVTANESSLPRAWIAARDIQYDVGPLVNGLRVTELWDEDGGEYGRQNHRRCLLTPIKTHSFTSFQSRPARDPRSEFTLLHLRRPRPLRALPLGTCTLRIGSLLGVECKSKKGQINHYKPQLELGSRDQVPQHPKGNLSKV